MPKLIAILNVTAWAGFWAFGYLALTAGNDTQVTTAVLLAALGGALGLAAWLWLVRHAEATGFARRSNQMPREHHRAGEGEA
ncbi:MAG: hypothetical protein CVT84_13465 [Alphaproteobacteria bacterium HGW-Alphaproteobacteria-6]|nr:MAG: hypothetical protein CVT84_13465 [Alphaproteobacteria bacterium HGW-Alphaproteobacteria-6]